MRPSEIEEWALRIADRVKAGEKVEDDRVELKREWPEPKRAARRIAGHANAARGEDVLWLIGLDEAEGVRGADHAEVANWYPQVAARFDRIPPPLIHHLNVPVDERTVVALVFDASRGPYVVKTDEQGGGVDREVPWREGTRVRSARREDLLRLLVPRQRRPRIDVLELSLSCTEYPNREEYELSTTLYIVPMTPERICFPVHRLLGDFRIAGLPETTSTTFTLTDILFRQVGSPHTAVASTHELLVDGPCRVWLTGACTTPRNVLSSRLHLDARLTISSADDQQSFTIRETLVPTRADPGNQFVAFWTRRL